MTAGRMLPAVGLAGALAGGQLLAISALRAADAWQPVVAAGVAAAGWMLLAGGSGRPRDAVRAVRAGGVEIWLGYAAAALAVLSYAPGLYAAGVQAVLAAALAGVRRRPAAPNDGAALPWRGAHALVGAVVAVFAVTAFGALEDVFPFSRFPMYSVAMDSPFDTDRIVFRGYAADGAVRELPASSSRQVLLKLGGWRDGQVSPALRRLADGMRERYGMARVEVVRERQRVAQYPAPPGMEVVRSRTLYEANGS
jgi:hypothetical protein